MHIKEDEKSLMLYFIIFFVVLGSGMAIGRGTTDALFFKRYGIEYLPVMYIILGFLLFLTSTVYAAFADRLAPEKFFKILNIVIVMLLLGAWSLMTFFTFDHVYPVYFLIYEIASEILVVHATLYMAKNMDILQAKRLTPVILAGAQVGTIIGGLFLALSASSLGVQNLLLVWCALLVIGIMMLSWHHNKIGYSLYFRRPRKSSNKLKQSMQDVSVGLKFMKKSELVRYSSFALFFMVIVFYILAYSTNKIYNNTFQTEESLTAFFGVMVVITNSLALILQLFVTNRAVNHFGIKKVNLFFPFTTLLCYIAMLFSFALPSGILASINKDAIMPSLRNPISNLFYNALPEFIQGRARAMSIAVVIPLALLVCGGILWIAQRMDNPVYFLSIGFVLTCLYGFYNMRMNKAYVREIVTHLQDNLFIPGNLEQSTIITAGDDILKELIQGVQHENTQMCVTYAKTVVRVFPEQAAVVLIDRLPSANNSIKDQLIKVLEPLKPENFVAVLWKEYATADSHLQSTILKILFKQADEQVLLMISELLAHISPRLRAVAIYGCILNNIEIQAAYIELSELLKSKQSGDVSAALDILKELDGHAAKALTNIELKIFTKLLARDNKHILCLTLQVAALLPENSIKDLYIPLIRVYHTSDPTLRIATVKCAHVLKEEDEYNFILNAINDTHPLVRETAINLFKTKNIMETFIVWIKDKNIGTPRTQASMLAKLDELSIPSLIMEDIAISKARDAQKVLQVINTLQCNTVTDNNHAVDLTLCALQERLVQIIELTLQAMKSIEDPYTIDIIQAGIKNKDQRIVAQSMEALRNIDNQRLALILSNIIEETISCSVTKKDDKSMVRTTKDALNWCIKRHDSWLKTCAEKALQSI